MPRQAIKISEYLYVPLANQVAIRLVTRKNGVNGENGENVGV